MDGKPALLWLLVAVHVFSRIVQNGNADVSVPVDVGVPDVRDELHLGGLERVISGKGQMGFEYAAFVERVRRPDDHHLPAVQVAVLDQAC